MFKLVCWDRKRPLILAALITLLLFSACGGSAEPSAEPSLDETIQPTPEEVVPTEPPPTPTTVPTPSPEPTLSAEQRLDQGRTFMGNDQLEEALAELQLAAELEPDNVDVLADLGGALITLQRSNEAMEILNHAYGLDPEHQLTLTNLCSALALQDVDNALEICEVALVNEPENDDIYNALGIIYVMAGLIDEAIASFEKAIELESEDGWAHNNLGYTYIQIEQFDKAIIQLQEALSIMPENDQAQYNLGLAFARSGQLEEAMLAYQKTIELDPTYASAYFDLAIIFTQLELLEEAIPNFETYLELRPDDPERENILREIERLRGFVLVDEAIASPETVDFANPASVLQAVFYAAENELYKELPTLCDPEMENDGDTALICEVTADHEQVDEFYQFFANGRIDGSVTFDGEFAELPFLFGENGDVAETMRFIERDGKWYLHDF